MPTRRLSCLLCRQRIKSLDQLPSQWLTGFRRPARPSLESRLLLSRWPPDRRIGAWTTSMGGGCPAPALTLVIAHPQQARGRCPACLARGSARSLVPRRRSETAERRSWTRPTHAPVTIRARSSGPGPRFPSPNCRCYLFPYLSTAWTVGQVDGSPPRHQAACVYEARSSDTGPGTPLADAPDGGRLR